MTLRSITSKTGKIVADNSPVILTGLGVAGVVTTAYLAGKASFKAAEVLAANPYLYPADAETNRPLETKEKFARVWKLYIPAAGVGSFTIAAIICSNRIGMRRTAAMTAAYAISERAYSEYKDKVVDTIGKSKEMKVRDEIAQDRVNALPTNHQIIVTDGGQQLFMDSYSMRPFTSDMETVKKAQNDTNHEILNHGYASLSDFYNRLGLSNTKISDDIGWNSDKLLEVTFSAAITDDQRTCMVMDFAVAPVRNFFRSH